MEEQVLGMEPLFARFGVKKNAGEILFCEYEPGKTVFFLIKGTLKLSKITKDKEKTLAYLKNGAVVGEMSLLDNKPRSASCVAETDCELLEFDKENFETLVQAKPSLGIKLLFTFVKRLQDQERKLRLLKHKTDEAKVLDTILMLIEEKGLEESSKKVLLQAKPKEIAIWAGITSEACQEIIDKLDKSDKINVNEQGIVVKNIENIRTILSKDSNDYTS